ncbi:unnamed protein product [Polarella glacialis]|uniref:ATP-grasp domain-containing protein n=1 Tax=Polarella glacialis TaxID=89957 RepID=A0A813EZU9_POLGL|nr:unnamed protein product [Polarella glacialis]
MWDYTDCNYQHCGEFLYGGAVPFEERLHQLLVREKLDYIVTHNANGEYGHIQHSGLCSLVTAALGKLRAEGAHAPQMLVFNPMPELNITQTVGKKRMFKAYTVRVSKARWQVFDALQHWSEHIIPVDLYLRPSELGLVYMQGIIQGTGLPFMHYWPLFPDQPWQQGKYTAEKGIAVTEKFFARMLEEACDRKTDVLAYPHMCAALRRQLANSSSDLYKRAAYQQERFAQTPDATLPKPEIAATLRCVMPQQRVGKFGKIVSFKFTAQSASNAWVEALVFRPILVGWKQGYKGRSYKIIGSSGISLVNPAYVGEATVRAPGGIAVQPDDVLGWGVYDNVSADELEPLPRGEQQKQMCIGRKGCDEAGLCTLDTPQPDNLSITVQAITAEVKASAAVPKKKGFEGMYEVMEALDISEFVEADTSYEELMTLRHRLQHPDLGLFEDKIRLRAELLPAAGVLATPSIHMSNQDFDVARFLHDRKSYVVKPSHMSESQNVFVMQDGVNLLLRAWGNPHPYSTVEEIQQSVNSFSKQHALDWECKALVGASPGVIVEELVLAASSQNQLFVDEYKFYTSWGQVVLAESVPFSSGAMMEIDRDGQILTHKMECPPWCVSPCYRQMVEIAERVAQHARTDFLRVDILRRDCEALFVSEVELFPGSDFSQAVKDAIAQRWREGYGV